MDSRIRKLARYALRFGAAAADPTAPPEEEYDSPEVIAARTRQLCREHGIHEIAAAIGAPPDVEHPRFIAYLLVSATELPDEARELAIQAALLGFAEHSPTTTT